LCSLRLSAANAQVEGSSGGGVAGSGSLLGAGFGSTRPSFSRSRRTVKSSSSNSSTSIVLRRSSSQLICTQSFSAENSGGFCSAGDPGGGSSSAYTSKPCSVTPPRISDRSRPRSTMRPTSALSVWSTMIGRSTYGSAMRTASSSANTASST